MKSKIKGAAVGGALVAAAALTLFAARNDFGLGRNMEITVNMMRPSRWSMSTRSTPTT